MSAVGLKSNNIVGEIAIFAIIRPEDGAVFGEFGDLSGSIIHFFGARHMPALPGNVVFFGHDTLILLRDKIKHKRIKHFDPFLKKCDPLYYINMN